MLHAECTHVTDPIQLAQAITAVAQGSVGLSMSRRASGATPESDEELGEPPGLAGGAQWAAGDHRDRCRAAGCLRAAALPSRAQAHPASCRFWGSGRGAGPRCSSLRREPRALSPSLLHSHRHCCAPLPANVPAAALPLQMRSVATACDGLRPTRPSEQPVGGRGTCSAGRCTACACPRRFL